MNHWKPIAQIVEDVASGSVSALELVEDSLSRIKGNESFNSIIITLDDSAKKRAIEIDKKINNSEKIGRLAGIPFIAKDNILVFGGATTAASDILRGFEAPYQATVIE